MFSVAERTAIRAELIALAENDSRIVGAALAGSAARGTEDAWSAPPNIDTAIGLGWLYALHARSATARGKLWQAAMMIDELRNKVVELKCARAGLDSWHGRDVDALPATELEQLEATRVIDLTAAQLDAARTLLTDQLLDEVAHADPSRADRLTPAFDELRGATR